MFTHRNVTVSIVIILALFLCPVFCNPASNAIFSTSDHCHKAAKHGEGKSAKQCCNLKPAIKNGDQNHCAVVAIPVSSVPFSSSKADSGPVLVKTFSSPSQSPPLILRI